MGMVGQVPGPGVEDAHHADLPAEIFRLQGEALQGSRGGLKEQIGEAVLMRTGYRAQCFRQRKGHKKVRDRQEEHTLLFQPTRGRCILARGTMPVLTGMIAVLEFSARCALTAMAAPPLVISVYHFTPGFVQQKAATPRSVCEHLAKLCLYIGG